MRPYNRQRMKEEVILQAYKWASERWPDNEVFFEVTKEAYIAGFEEVFKHLRELFRDEDS